VIPANEDGHAELYGAAVKHVWEFVDRHPKRKLRALMLLLRAVGIALRAEDAAAFGAAVSSLQCEVRP
jgi:hypothetical protein